MHIMSIPRTALPNVARIMMSSPNTLSVTARRT
jgi:hypothetical protein